MRCLEHMKITEILRLYEMKAFTYREIGDSVGCSKSSVGEIIKRCKECGLAYDDAKVLTQERLNELIYPDSFGRKQVKEEPDWDSIHNRLQSSRRINLQYIWEEEYRPNNPEGYSYSHFCSKYNAWKKVSGKKVVFPQERTPGKELFVDWMGDTLPCIVDRETGEILEAHFFVATLGDSSYPFVEAFPNETQLNWLQAHVDALQWYGGTPRIIVPDNCKTAVTHTNIYDPQLNKAYRELARHYGVAVIPARVRKPRDKAAVESGIGWLETWLLEWLKGSHYFSFEALNHDIRERVKALAKKDFQKREGSRESNFLALDKPALNPLPKDVFEIFETKHIKRVPNNYHIECYGFYYSIPYIYYDNPVSVHIYAKKVEIHLTNGECVAIHHRRFAGRRYVTEISHMPSNHQAVANSNRYDGTYYRKRAAYIGTHAGRFVNLLLEKAQVEEQAYKSCMAVLNFCGKYGDSRVNKACEKAIALNSVNYTTLLNILKNGQDKQPTTHNSDAEKPIPYHENLRIGEWE